MTALTPKERVFNLLHRKSVDRAAFHDHLWTETVKRWRSEGHYDSPDQSSLDRFEMEIQQCACFTSIANMDFKDVVVEEDEETILTRNGNGALLRRWKSKSGTPEHVDFLVKDRRGWEEHIKPFLKPERRRIKFEVYRNDKNNAAEKERFFVWSGINVFEQMHPVCGHENLLVGMALDPDWVREMTRMYADLTIGLWEILFTEEGLPDGIWFSEDLGFKGKPFMSPAMYADLIQPEHARIIAWAHDHGLKVIMHSCGFVEPLLPGMIAAGIDMLQAMEVKAGMDVVRLNRLYGDKIGFIGNIDTRELISNDRRRIDAELTKKIPPLMATRTPYIVSSDHSIPPEIDFDSFVYFRDRGLELAQYKQ